MGLPYPYIRLLRRVSKEQDAFLNRLNSARVCLTSSSLMIIDYLRRHSSHVELPWLILSPSANANKLRATLENNPRLRRTSLQRNWLCSRSCAKFRRVSTRIRSIRGEYRGSTTSGSGSGRSRTFVKLKENSGRDAPDFAFYRLRAHSRTEY